MKKLVWLFCIALVPLFGACKHENEVEIVWDTWGVPHIYGETDAQLAYGLAWGQMHNHGNLILTLYGKSKGRAAEFWGSSHLESDRRVWTMGVPQEAKKQYSRLNRAERAAVESFAQGINDYAEKHGDSLEHNAKLVLPLSGIDVVQQIVYALYTPNHLLMDGIIQQFSANTQSPGMAQNTPNVSAASNGWVIGPNKSASGRSMLLSNTHFPWSNFPGFEHLLWHEAHLIGDDIDIYGVGLVGLPALTMGFNSEKAWTVTAANLNNFDTLDTYAITKQNGGYVFDGEQISFDADTIVLRVKEADGSLSESPLTVKRTVHGPVVFETNTSALAVKTAIPNKVASNQLWQMAKAEEPEEFLDALQGQNLPPLNILYADKEGNILHTMVGPYPDREFMIHDPSPVLPGDTSANLWSELLPFNRMPILMNPESAYLQNANETPWSNTLPPQLDPSNFPKDWAEPFVTLRAARSLKMLTSRDRYTIEDMIQDKFSTYSELSERILSDLITTAESSSDPSIQQAVEVLKAWDGNYNSDSIGAFVFTFWLLEYSPATIQGFPFPNELYAQAYDPQQPLSTPRGLANPDAALAALQTASQKIAQDFGSFYIPWGTMFRFRLEGEDLPGYGAPGSLGVFSANVGLPEDGAFVTSMGDTWVLALDFADPDNAMAVTSYSNASQPGSPHTVDQLALYTQKQLRPVWRTADDINDHSELRETLELPETFGRRSR